MIYFLIAFAAVAESVSMKNGRSVVIGYIFRLESPNDLC
jgi:hypothetical protein